MQKSPISFRFSCIGLYHFRLTKGLRWVILDCVRLWVGGDEGN